MISDTAAGAVRDVNNKRFNVALTTPCHVTGGVFKRKELSLLTKYTFESNNRSVSGMSNRACCIKMYISFRLTE